MLLVSNEKRKETLNSTVEDDLLVLSHPRLDSSLEYLLLLGRLSTLAALAPVLLVDDFAFACKDMRSVQSLVPQFLHPSNPPRHSSHRLAIC